VILGVGATESQRVVSWYTSTNDAQVVQVAPSNQIKKGVFPDDATSYSATTAANAVNGGYNAHVTIDGLKQNTEYSYRVGTEGSWSPVYTFKTQTFYGASDWDFLFFGDPQIGSSGSVAQDAAGWRGKAYEQHLWTPNTDRSASYYRNGNPAGAESGGDYWFIYKDVLFIDLNSNAYANGADAAHIGYVTSVVNAHGSQAKYTVLVYHHSIYSPADHANDNDNKIRRQDFPTAFSNLGVDLVLQGHDHSYSRSYEINNGQKANPDEQPGDAEVTQGPGGVIYVTANSASGSKYYDLTAPVAGEYGPDPLNPKSHYANSVENQRHVRTYVKVSVQNGQLVVQDIRSGTCATPNSAVELRKVSWCGPNSGASPAQPVGSVVDSVVINSYDAKAVNNGADNNVDAVVQNGPSTTTVTTVS